MNGEHESVRHRLVAWRGQDPDRVDAAVVMLGDDRLSAHGTSTCAGYTLSYRLRTTASWVTRSLDVATEAHGWRRRLTLLRDEVGRWTAHRSEIASDRQTDAPTTALPDLDDALDCDLGLCPLTNTMPILREGLIAAAQRGDQRRVELRMAWVSVPDLRVSPSTQRYAADGVVSGGVRIAFASGRFAATIEVDADGLVVDYPGIGRRL